MRSVGKQETKPESENFERQRIGETASGVDKNVKAKRFILAAKLFSAPYAKELDLNEIDFTDETHKIIAEYVLEHEAQNERIRPSELFERLDEDCAELSEILDLNYGDKLTGEVAERIFQDSVRALEREQIEAKITAYGVLYKETQDETERKEITARLQSLLKKRNELKK